MTSDHTAARSRSHTANKTWLIRFHAGCTCTVHAETTVVIVFTAEDNGQHVICSVHADMCNSFNKKSCRAPFSTDSMFISCYCHRNALSVQQPELERVLCWVCSLGRHVSGPGVVIIHMHRMQKPWKQVNIQQVIRLIHRCGWITITLGIWDLLRLRSVSLSNLARSCCNMFPTS